MQPLGSRLHNHDAECVRHDVVELARDPRSLFRDRELRPLLALLLELTRSLGELCGDQVA